jgi:hypothetical protein
MKNVHRIMLNMTTLGRKEKRQMWNEGSVKKEAHVVMHTLSHACVFIRDMDITYKLLYIMTHHTNIAHGTKYTCT